MSEEPSVVFAKKQPSDDRQWFDLQHRRGLYPPVALPTEPPPPGLNIHQLCLFDKINQFCGHQLTRAKPTHLKPHQSTAATVCPSREVAAAIGTSENDKRSSDCVVLCQKQTEHMAKFCEPGMRFFRCLPIFRHFVVRKRTREKRVNPGRNVWGGHMGVRNFKPSLQQARLSLTS